MKKLERVAIEVWQNREVLVEYGNFYIKNKELNLELERLNLEVEKIKGDNEIRLRLIAEEYETRRLLIERVFGERAFALRAQYEALHEGLSSGNKDIIVGALNNISHIISINPAETLQQLQSPNKVLELDF